jgi:hypothetical protein
VKKRYLLFLITLIHLSSSAQISDVFADDFPDSSMVRMGIAGNYNFNSNALTNQFISKFYTGGYINNDLKNSVLTRVKNNNRLGADVSYGIYTAFKLDSLFHKKNLSFFFSLRDRFHVDGQFSKDLFKVGFYGNAQYAGKTADFDGFNFNMIRYQQFQIGIYSSKYDVAAHWGIGLSFLKGEEYLSILAKKAEMFTSEDGQYIDFNVE